MIFQSPPEQRSRPGDGGYNNQRERERERERERKRSNWGTGGMYILTEKSSYRYYTHVGL
jgi:hypothetical protein